MRGYDPTDTIVAPATALATSALGIVRLSGPRAWEIALSLAEDAPVNPQAGHVYVVWLTLVGEIRERAVITLWQAGHSYTGDQLAELSLHGNPLLIQQCVAACAVAGARPAEPGEFTYRAYVNGKLDLAQAEAVQELITAGSLRALALASSALSGIPSQHVHAWVARLTALLAEIEVIHDYAASDLDASLDATALLTPARLNGELATLLQELNDALEVSRRAAPLREGITVAICGPPNVGKSTLFNALLGQQRALVSPEPGTTRDYITETLDSGGIRLTLVDTAGYRDTANALEAAGVARAGDWARAADHVLWVTAADGEAAPSTLLEPPLRPDLEDLGDRLIRVSTKCDLLPAWPQAQAGAHCVSGLDGRGVHELWEALRAISAELDAPASQVFTQRQASQITAAVESLNWARTALADGLPLDAVALDLNTARAALHGVYEQEDRGAVVREIFSRFCVGK